MKRVVVSGLGLITSIGNSRETVAESLRTAHTGIEPFPAFAAADCPVKLAGTVKEFEFPTPEFEDWIYPAEYQLPRERMRTLAPNSLYAYAAMRQAIADAGLTDDLVTSPRTGLMTASGGSMWLAYENYHTMLTRGVMRCQPMGIINGIPGSLYINLGTLFGIKGSAVGFSSACSSSAHAIGAAVDLIRSDRQDLVFAVGAEDCNLFSILPFAAIRALSVHDDPEQYPCPFDRKRDGFVGTGGAAVLVLEESEHARQRGAPVYAELAGWGQSCDGYNVLAPDPDGDGLARAISRACEDAGLEPGTVDYINAHATGTPGGDVSECRAIQQVFGDHTPLVSSTKAITGHGLSLAGSMEAAFCCLALQERFVPVSAHVTELDPACQPVRVVTEPVDVAPRVVMSNSAGFGGSNVSLVFQSPAHD